jgi:hypothetical protein
LLVAYHSPGSLSPEESLAHLLSSSGKLQLLDRLMTKLVARGHRVLIYSQVREEGGRGPPGGGGGGRRRGGGHRLRRWRSTCG